MNEKDIIKKMRAGRCIKNNGKVLRAINLLRSKYERLEEVKYALPDITESEFLDSINYLSECKYLNLRHIDTKAAVDISDVDYVKTEAKLSGLGIRLLAGITHDELVEV